jgi:hypothetical protein
LQETVFDLRSGINCLQGTEVVAIAIVTLVDVKAATIEGTVCRL